MDISKSNFLKRIIILWAIWSTRSHGWKPFWGCVVLVLGLHTPDPVFVMADDSQGSAQPRPLANYAEDRAAFL